MNKKFFLIFMFLFSFIFLLLPHPSYARLFGFYYRRNITINNTANSNTLTDYQVAINLTYSSNMQPDFSDIRFTDTSDSLLSYWIESKVNSQWAYVWVKVPYIPASSYATIYVYYGNTTPVTSLSNGDATFLLFDDFLGTTLNTSKWGVAKSSVVGDTSSSGFTVTQVSSGFNPGIWRFSWVSTGKQIGSDGVNTLTGTNTTNTIANYYAFFGIPGSPFTGSVVLDWVRVRKYTSPEPTYSIGAEEIVNQPPTITIVTPQNQTYFSQPRLEFSVSDDNSSVFWVKVFLNGELIYENANYQNNTPIAIYKNYVIGQNNYTVWANDTQGATSSLTVIFTIKDFEIQQITFNSIVYETTTQLFTETIRVNFDLVSNITANLFWNSTDKGYCPQSVNSTHIVLSQTIDIPLVQTNNTAINFFFRNYITYANGSSIITDSSTNTQNILFAYIPQNIILGNNFLEYDDIKPTLNITILYNNSQTQFFYLWNLTNGTNYKTASEASPTIINFENYLANETRNLTLTLNISFQNSSRVYNFSKNFTSYMTMLTNCSYLSTTQTLSFIFKDEETQSTLSPMNYTYISIYVSPQNLRKQRFYDFTNLQNICIYPSWAIYFANVSAVARKDNYAVATHVPYQISVLTNSSQTITVYLIPLSISSPITFTLPGSNYIFVAERQYGSNFVYIRSDLSDFNRKVVMYLRPYDTYYRITIYSEMGKLCFASSGFKVASSTYEITSCTAITNISYPSPWYQQNINYNCTKTQNGNITNVKCDFYALDNLDHDFYLVVYKYNEPWGKTLYSNQTLHTVSGSLSVDLGEGAYDVYLYAHSNPEYLWTTFVNNKVLIVSTEIFFFLILLYCLSCVVGWFNPFIGLLFNIIITFIASFLGLATFPQQAIAGLTILFIFAIMFTREWK